MTSSARRFLGRIHTRLTLQVTLLTILFLGGLVAIVLTFEWTAFLERTKGRAAGFALDVLAALDDGMMQGDRDAVRPLVRSLTAAGSPETIRILDREGKVRVSSRPEEEGVQYTLDDPTCRVCHGVEPSLRSDTLVLSLGGRDVFRSVTPIPNRPSCREEEGGCHDSDRKFNGVFIVDTPVEGFYRERNSLLLRLMLYVLGGGTVVALAGAWTVHRVLLKPMGKVEKTLKAIGQGDFSQRVPATGAEEIRTLAHTLNLMSARIENLLAERQQAEQAGKMAAVGEVAAEFAHDIGSALDGAMDCMRILKEPDTSEERRQKYARLALEGMERVEFMARKLLLFGQQRALKIVLTDLNFTVSRALDFVGVRIARRKIRLEKRLDEGIGDIETDAEGLTQILINLFLNSLDAMGEEGGTLSVSTGRASEGSVFVRIEDSGPGIPPEIRDRIFQPFFTTKKEGRGAGLGLYIARKVLSEIGGALVLEERETEGAAFLVTLPRNPSRGAQGDRP